MAFSDFCGNIGSEPAPALHRAAVEVGAVESRLGNVRNDDFADGLVAGFDDHVPLRQVLEPLSQMSSAAEVAGYLRSFGNTRPKKALRAGAEQRGPDSRREHLQL